MNPSALPCVITPTKAAFPSFTNVVLGWHDGPGGTGLLGLLEAFCPKSLGIVSYQKKLISYTEFAFKAAWVT